MVPLFILYVLLSASGLFLMKVGGESASIGIINNFLKLDVSLTLLLGMLCYLISFLLFIYIINKNDISYIYPVSAGALNIVTFILGVAVLKEKINGFSVAGLILIAAGVVFMNLK